MCVTSSLTLCGGRRYTYHLDLAGALGHCDLPVSLLSNFCAVTTGLGGFDEDKQIHFPLLK